MPVHVTFFLKRVLGRSNAFGDSIFRSPTGLRLLSLRLLLLQVLLLQLPLLLLLVLVLLLLLLLLLLLRNPVLLELLHKGRFLHGNVGSKSFVISCSFTVRGCRQYHAISLQRSDLRAHCCGIKRRLLPILVVDNEQVNLRSAGAKLTADAVL